MLEDILAAGLGLVICGVAASPVSAARGEYYAGPGNRFWRILHETGLTPRQLAPGESRSLLLYGIGLTDLIKAQAGRDAALNLALSDTEGLRRKIERFRPAVLAFNGRAAAKVFLGTHEIAVGLQPETIGATQLFVAPSTSGAAGNYWDAEAWHELARLVKRRA